VDDLDVAEANGFVAEENAIAAAEIGAATDTPQSMEAL
jgi:hypothetical protein